MIIRQRFNSVFAFKKSLERHDNDMQVKGILKKRISHQEKLRKKSASC